MEKSEERLELPQEPTTSNDNDEKQTRGDEPKATGDDDQYVIISEEDYSLKPLVRDAKAKGDEAISEAIEETEATQAQTEVAITEKEAILIELVELKAEFHEWIDLREETIKRLRDIADYIDLVSQRTGWAKIVGSSGGAVAGGLTLIGGALTIASMGTALPILLAGTGLGLAAGVTGGAAAIADKVIKSQQMKEVTLALEADGKATEHLESAVTHLQENPLAKQVAKEVALSGAGAATNSLTLANLATAGGGGLSKIGAEAFSKIFGEDIGKEISKLILHTSGKVIAGSVTVVLGGVSMMYDIYKLNSNVNELAKSDAGDVRSIADQLEAALRGLIATM